MKLAKPVVRSIASFFNISLKIVLKIFWKNFLGDPTFSSQNANPRSAIYFSTHLCEGEKQSQLLSTTSPLWILATIVVHFRDKFVFSMLWNIMFQKWLFITMSKRACFIFQPIFPHFFGILAGHRAQRPISLPPVAVPAISSIAFFGDTTWRSSATALLAKLGLFHRYVDLSQCHNTFFDFLPSYKFRRNFSTGLHCHCKIVTWMFLALTAIYSSLIFASFAFYVF